MTKKYTYILSALAIVVALTIILFFFVFKPGVNYEKTDALKAVPETSPMFMVINDPTVFFNKLPNNEITSTLLSVQNSRSLFRKLEEAHAYISTYDDFTKLLRNNILIIALNYSGRDAVDPLFIIPLNSKNDADALSKLISSIKSDKNIQIVNRKYNKADISQLDIDNNSIFLAVHEGLCLVSDKSLIIEEAIRQTNTSGVNENPELETLMKTTGKQADINIFVNHKQADRLFTKHIADNIKTKAQLVKTYASWTEIDLNLSSDRILLSGFTSGNKNENYYANVFLNQQALASRADRFLPGTTTFYTTLVLSDINKFMTDYEDFLKKRNLYFQREDQLAKIERETGKNTIGLLLEITDQEFTMAGIISDQNNPSSGRIWTINTKSGSLAQEKLIELQKEYITRKKLAETDWRTDYKIDDQTSFPIYRFPYPNLASTTMGQIFSGVQTNWFAVYENTVIFGDSHRTVARALHANVLGETLSGNMDYNRFRSNLSNKSNLTFYCNTATSLPIASALFNSEIASQITDNEDLRKFKSFAWQITATGTMLYNNACLSYNPEIKSKPQTIWQSNIGSAFDFKPKFVINHNDRQNKEIVIQDNDNNFYLLNNIGRVLWQLKLDSPILGEVHQIDYFKNGKLQYIFNTENKIYLIDRNGNSVRNFPVNLRAKASNGLSVFDYNNTRDYRIFIACTDRNIYAYNMDGNLLNGWNIYRTDHEISKPVQHFRVDGKDYIVASDKMRDYILHRRGTIRVNTNAVYDHSSNNTIYLEERTQQNAPRFVTTDTKGNLHFTYLTDGNHEIISFNEASDKHFFVSENITQDQDSEYIFADGRQLTIYDSNGKELLNKKFEHEISHRPNIYTFSGGVKKIGITCKSANKIYLIDMNGKMHPGFPLDGCTEFSIGFISSEMSNFNLLVGSPDGFLYNYYVE
jgi:hypothetical protein